LSNEHYLHNPLIHRDRRLGHRSSDWVKQFDCSGIRSLIICRGPIRKEAIDVFREMGISHIGILLSEKDSIVYQNALAPELRVIDDPERVHRVPDYTGANKEERDQRIKQIIGIARANDYNAIFAGYGFMAEDETMVAAMEQAGLMFIGPCSRTVHGAGLKDEAKRTALKSGVSVTPGVDNATALTLLKKHPDRATLAALAEAVLRQDTLALIEPKVENLVEYNIAMMWRGGEVVFSAIERPKSGADLLDFKEKYLSSSGPAKGTFLPSEGMLSLTREIDPALPPDMLALIHDYARRAFLILGHRGAPRIDFMCNAETGELWFNEINPIPGSYGFFLWEAAKVPLLYPELIDHLVTEALASSVKRFDDPVPQDAYLLPR
jgi:D-alanine-D-alanine ligase-like ATP-grasp enzyme